VPLLRQALAWVGHVQTRIAARSAAASRTPTLAPSCRSSRRCWGRACCCGSGGGARTLEAEKFFVGPMATNVRPGECLEEIHWPAWSWRRTGVRFHEISMRHGDFAMVAAAAQIAVDGDGRCVRAAFGLGGVGGTPLAFPGIAARLVGTRLDDAVVKDAANAAAAESKPARSARERRIPRHLAVCSGRACCTKRATGRGACSERDPSRHFGSKSTARRDRPQVPARLSLVDWLREDLYLTGTHIRCEHGICGACSVMLDGEPVRSCLMYAVQATATASPPSRARAADGSLSVLQDSFCEAHGLQCGYCTPGMLIASQALLNSIRIRPKTRFATPSAETCAAAPATSRSSRPCSSPRTHGEGSEMKRSRRKPTGFPLLVEEGCRRRRRGGRALWSNHPALRATPPYPRRGKT